MPFSLSQAIKVACIEPVHNATYSHRVAHAAYGCSLMGTYGGAGTVDMLLFRKLFITGAQSFAYESSRAKITRLYIRFNRDLPGFVLIVQGVPELREMYPLLNHALTVPATCKASYTRYRGAYD